jgi:hypothetical protein
MAFLVFRERNMDTTPKEQPHSADATPSPVRASKPETTAARKRVVPSAPADPQQANDEPGYGHGV